MIRARRLWYVPIEPFEGRYTKSWYENFPAAFAQYFGEENVHVIDGVPLSTTIRVGTFLDMSSTLHYKATQLQAIARLFNDDQIQDGDVFFFGDIEYWGLESIRLTADMHGLKKVAVTGFLHAASYTKDDAFAIAAPYQQYTETGWIASLDRVFVGSQYHKDAVEDRRLQFIAPGCGLYDRIQVTGNPMFAQDYAGITPAAERLPIIVFPNRFDSEKRAYESIHTAEVIQSLTNPRAGWTGPEVRCLFTTSHGKMRSNDPRALERLHKLATEDGTRILLQEGLTKAEYHLTLANAAVMVTMSPEENFGYCVAEALHYGCSPLMLDCASHPEFLSPLVHPDNFVSPQDDYYNVAVHTVALLRKVLETPQSYYSPLLSQSMHAADTIARSCFNLQRQ